MLPRVTQKGVIQMTRNKVLALVPIVGLSFALLASPGHGYVSVSAAAFQPEVDGYDYLITHQISNFNNTSQYWVAPVQLPQGAMVTKITFYWYDRSFYNASLRLDRHNRTISSYSVMAEAWSSDDTGDGSTEDTSIDYAVIDNTQYNYWVWVHLPRTATRLYGVTIEYTYPVSLPLVVRNLQTRLGGR
jgi:hypothetical protein